MLPQYYEYDEATNHLERIVSASLERGANEDAGEHPQLSQAKLESYSVVEYPEPRCWKLSTVDSNTGVAEPVLIRMIGAISDLHLAPIPKPTTPHAIERMRPHLRQSIALTGLHSTSFHKNHTVLEEVHVKILGSLPANSVIPWQPSYEAGLLVINMHNRFFTKRSLVPNRTKEPFHYHVDPNGYLEAMQNDMKYIHTSDNRVEFYSSERDTNKTIPANPTIFRPGDFVEVTIEFAAFPVADNKHLSAVILRGVKMLTPEYRNRAAIVEMRTRYKSPYGPPIQIKRKALYVDVDEAGERLKRMHMSDPDNSDRQTQNVQQPATQQQPGEGQQSGVEQQPGDVLMNA